MSVRRIPGPLGAQRRERRTMTPPPRSHPLAHVHRVSSYPRIWGASAALACPPAAPPAQLRPSCRSPPRCPSSSATRTKSGAKTQSTGGTRPTPQYWCPSCGRVVCGHRHGIGCCSGRHDPLPLHHQQVGGAYIPPSAPFAARRGSGMVTLMPSPRGFRTSPLSRNSVATSISAWDRRFTAFMLFQRRFGAATRSSWHGSDPLLGLLPFAGLSRLRRQRDPKTRGRHL